MQKWEYYVLEGSGPRVVRANGELLVPSRVTHLFLNELGEEGWELVSVTTTSGGSNQYDQYVFKRPKS